MAFDDEVDALKSALLESMLDPAGRREATGQLCGKLTALISSKRIEFAVEGEDPEPYVSIRHTSTSEQLAAVFVNEDGSVTFQSALQDDDDGDVDGGEYFPPFAEYFDENEFLEDAPEMLKLGLAKYELDLESVE